MEAAKPDEPLILSYLTRREREFVRHYATGAVGIRGNRVNSYYAAGYSPIKAHARQCAYILLQRQRVKDAIAALSADQAPLPVDESEHPGGSCETLGEFVRAAWPIVDPHSLLWGLPCQAITEHLEAVTRGDLTKLIINVPPGHGKTLHTCVLWPSWVWTKRPQTQFLFGSYSFALNEQSSVKRMNLLESEWYQSRWGHVWSRGIDRKPIKWTNHRCVNDKGGTLELTSMSGKSSGKHCNILVIDDPHDRDDVFFPHRFLEKTRYYDNNLKMCVIPGEMSAVVVIMQRLSDRDMTAHLLEQGGWTLLKLQTRYTPSSRCKTPFWSDPRKTNNQLLWPELFPAEKIKELEDTQPPRVFAAHQQQEPSSEHGNIVLRDWWKFYQDYEVEDGKVYVLAGGLRREVTKLVSSWDTTFGGGKHSDYVSGQVWGRAAADFFLLANVHRKMGISESRDALRAQFLEWPQVRERLIEKGGNGIALADSLRNEFPGFILIDVTRSKEARVSSVSYLIRAGNVYVPDPAKIGWVKPYIEEWANFPTGKYDDQVDAGTQALIYLTKATIPFGISVKDDRPKHGEHKLPGAGGKLFDHGRRQRVFGRR